MIDRVLYACLLVGECVRTQTTSKHAPTCTAASHTLTHYELTCRTTAPPQTHPPPPKTHTGYGVFPNEQACCAPQGPGPLTAAPGAFPQGCGNVTKAAEPCWVVDTYWPSRQCRQSRTLCGAGGLECGVLCFKRVR